MIKKDFEEEIKKLFDECQIILTKKNHDYGGEDEDVFACFEKSRLVNVDPRDGILVRITDKLSRITTLTQTDNLVKEETIQDTLKDLINYTAILYCYLQSYESKNRNIL